MLHGYHLLDHANAHTKGGALVASPVPPIRRHQPKAWIKYRQERLLAFASLYNKHLSLLGLLDVSAYLAMGTCYNLHDNRELKSYGHFLI